MKDILEEEISKNIKEELEKEHLGDVLIKLNDEILNGIKYRKNIGEIIVKNRENALSEYRDDEDKVADYFDHENFIKEEAYRSVDKRLKELVYLINSPYFGRVDFRELEDDEILNIYIGKYGFIPDKESEALIIDWRAPVSSLFYNENIGEANYRAPLGDIPVNVLLKRQFIIKNGEFKGMFDSSIDIKDEILQMVLSQNSEEKLKEIVTTIQKEQDDIIREMKNVTVVVNGVAGSGKTTIALHRIAYLLYNYRDTLKGKVLILGPNSIFMDYIKEVLPSLGEENIPQSTFNDMVMDFLGIESIMEYSIFMEKILDNDEEFIKEVKYKRSEEYIYKLDLLIESIQGDYLFKDIYLRDYLIMGEEEQKNLFLNYYKNMPLFKRLKKIKIIIYRKIKEVRDTLILKINKEFEEMSLLEEDEDKNNIQFLRSIRIRELIEDIVKLKNSFIDFTKGDLKNIYNKFNNYEKLISEDLAPMLYLGIKLFGVETKEEIKHIVIDEAQEFSPLQFIVLKEFTHVSSFTIVGDYHQTVIPTEGTVSMLSLDNHLKLDSKKYNLSKSYRSTKEIMEYAKSYTKDKELVPLVRNGTPVEEIEALGNSEMISIIEEKVREFSESGLESIAVITRGIKESEYIYNNLKDKLSISLLDKEDKVLRKGVSIIPSYFAKGLEFDGVIVPKMVEIEDNLLYIMCTRALHRLVVIENKK